MTTLLFANNAITVLASPITTSSTTISVAPGTGSLFPSPTSGQSFRLTLTDLATGLIYEILDCTSISGDSMTVSRAQEGTTAHSWSAGDKVAMFPTAGTMQNFAQLSGATFSGNVNFSANLSVGNGIATGLYGDNANISIRGYSSGNIYFQTANGASTYAALGSSGFNLGVGSFNGSGAGLTGTGSNFVAGTANALNSSNNYTISSTLRFSTNSGTGYINSADGNWGMVFQPSITGVYADFLFANTSGGFLASIDSSGVITAGRYFNGSGAGLTGTANGLTAGSANALKTEPYYDTPSNLKGYTLGSDGGGSGIYMVSTSNYITVNNIGSQSVNYANTAGVANSYNGSNDLYCQSLHAANAVYASSSDGDDAMVILRSASSIGTITAVNTSNNTYRWLKVGEGSPVLLGASSPSNGASLSVGSENGNGAIWCDNGNVANGQAGGYGWALVNNDGRMGAFTVGNGFIQVYLDGVAYGINVVPSDESIKKNIKSSTYNALGAIDKIEFKSFDYDEDKTFAKGHIACGVTSQQLETVDPAFINEIEHLKQPNTDKLLYVALKAIQELKSQVTALENQLSKGN
jgi:hypothetical protein